MKLAEVSDYELEAQSIALGQRWVELQRAQISWHDQHHDLLVQRIAYWVAQQDQFRASPMLAQFILREFANKHE